MGNDGGVAISYDKGGNWRYLNTMALGQFYDISFNMDKPYRVCGGLQDNGTWCGPSRLASGQVSKYHWATISGGDGFVTAQDPEDHNLVWAESQGGNMRRLNLATRQSNGLRKPNWEDGWRPLQDSIALLMDAGAPEDDPRVVAFREQASADSANSHHALELEHAVLPVGARPHPLLRGRQPGSEEHEPGRRSQDHLAGPVVRGPREDRDQHEYHRRHYPRRDRRGDARHDHRAGRVAARAGAPLRRHRRRARVDLAGRRRRVDRTDRQHLRRPRGDLREPCRALPARPGPRVRLL